MARLSVIDHDRNSAGLTYVYPVISRRAGGVSIGINLNPNNRCNWRCVYCQVPELQRGAAPPISEEQLETELKELLHRVQQPTWMADHVEAPYRKLVDIAFSGNGEPTTSHQLDSIVERVVGVLDDHGLASLPKVLITNGSMMHRSEIQHAVHRLGRAGGEVWFKLDSATTAGRQAINDTPSSPLTARRNLRRCAAACRTFIQTCVFAIDGDPPSDAEQEVYLRFITEELDSGTPLAGVLLYGIARPSMQPQAARLSRLSDAWIEHFGVRIRTLGLDVRVRP